MEVDEYLNTIRVIERLNRDFLNMLSQILDKLNLWDLSAAQAMVLYKIGETDITAGELTNRGYYLGSNPSYNLRKMADAGYLLQSRSAHDKRLTRITLSEKGLGVYCKLKMIFNQQMKFLGPDTISEDELVKLKTILIRLDTFWNNCENLIDI